MGSTPKVSAFAIKAGIGNPAAQRWAFVAQKTMYGGKRIASGDLVFVFASETEGGQGLIARGMVAGASRCPRTPGIARQTPRVDLIICVLARPSRPLGRSALKPFTDWTDGRPETELNFKFYRQATNKIVGLSQGAADFLDTFFPDTDLPDAGQAGRLKGRP